MAKIKNMGTGTARFKEGIIISGSAHQPNGTDSGYTLINSGSAKFEGGLIATGSKSNKYMAEVLNGENNSGHGIKIESFGNGSGTFLLDIDSRGNSLVRVRADGRVGIGVATPGQTLAVSDDIGIGENIIHRADGDTYFGFPANDQIKFIAGNMEMLRMVENGGSSEITFNDAASPDLDLVIKGDSNNPLFKCDAANNRVGIGGVGSPTQALEVGGDVGINEKLVHNGDTNTYLAFSGQNEINLVANGHSFLKYNGDILINNANRDRDTKIMADDGNVILHADAGTNRVGIGTTSPTELLEVNGTGKFSKIIATEITGSVITYTDGDDAITIDDGGYLKFNAGVKYSRGVRVSSGVSPAGNSSPNKSGGWIKFATFNCPGSNNLDTSASSFLVTMAGMESTTNRRLDGTFLVHSKFTNNIDGDGDGNSGQHYDSDGTFIYCEPLNADYLSGVGGHSPANFNPTTDLLMIFTDGDTTPVVDLYIKACAKDKECFVTHLGGTGNIDTTNTDVGWAINTNQSWSATEPAAPGGSVKRTGTWASKIFSKLGIVTNSPIAELDVAGKIAITAESNTPSQPADGQGYLYTKSDGKVYWRSHDIAEVDLTAAGGGGGGNAFTTVAVSGQNNVVADSSTDTLTLVAGSNVTLTTNDSSDSVTIAAAGGKVLQVVHVPFTGAMSSSSTSWVNVTDGNTTMQASITPTASTSKILVQVSANIAVKQNYAAVFQLWNGSAAVDGGVHPAGYNGTDTYNASSLPRDVGVLFSIFNTTNTYHNKGYAAMLEDAPNTTSQVTYTFRGRAAHASSTFYVNRNTRDQHRLEDSYLGSGITLIEIGA